MKEDYKRLIILLQKDIIDDIDKIADYQSKSRNEVIAQALDIFIKYKKNLNYRKKMIKGYIQMGRINKEIANEAIFAEEETNKLYEEILAECE